MATLIIPHTFVAGTPALASEVNANFQAVVGWTQGQISTDNLGILGARSIALPSSPTLAILSLAQTSSNIALNITNSGTDSSIVINQSGALATGKAAILINSPSTQTTVGAAEVAMNLATNSTIPALLINHGATPTMSLTKTQLSLFNGAVQATSAGVVNATTVNATTVASTNINTTGLITAIAPVSNALAIRLAGRSSDDASVLDFTTNNQATQYATVTANSGGLSFNLPDTADGYTFRVNNAIKGAIDNSGLDGQYLKSASVTNDKIVSLPYFQSGTINSAVSQNFEPGDITVYTNTLTTTKANAKVEIRIDTVADNARLDTNGSSADIDSGHLYINISGPGGYSSTPTWALYNGYYGITFGAFRGMTRLLILPTAGTYTFTFRMGRARGSLAPNYGYSIQQAIFFVRETIG